jgi:hypothetical protein
MQVPLQISPDTQCPDLGPCVCVQHGHDVLEIPGQVLQSSTRDQTTVLEGDLSCSLFSLLVRVCPEVHIWVQV